MVDGISSSPTLGAAASLPPSPSTFMAMTGPTVSDSVLSGSITSDLPMAGPTPSVAPFVAPSVAPFVAPFVAPRPSSLLPAADTTDWPALSACRKARPAKLRKAKPTQATPASGTDHGTKPSVNEPSHQQDAECPGGPEAASTPPTSTPAEGTSTARRLPIFAELTS